jgi:DNA (cytosine-5)-methyltransferase 1
MTWDQPAPTLTCRCIDVYCGRFTHPRQNRGISLREAAAIQTFPDNYEFFGTFFHIAKQIGNAVPVRFGKSLGTAIQRSVSQSRLS